LSGALHISAGGIAFGRLVKRDTAVLQACEGGDMDDVILLLSRGEARLTNTTSDGWTLMTVS
jgi:hypothetical protein